MHRKEILCVAFNFKYDKTISVISITLIKLKTKCSQHLCECQIKIVMVYKIPKLPKDMANR